MSTSGREPSTWGAIASCGRLAFVAMRWPRIVFPVVVVAVLVVGCGGSSSVRTARLSGAYTVRGQGHTIYVGVETEGTCLNAQRQPRLEPIEIDEPSGGEAVITATVRYFPLEGHSCFGVGLGYEQAIHTRRPVRQLTIYDGSESPPRRLGLPVMTRAEFREQMRGARHNAWVARRDREAD